MATNIDNNEEISTETDAEENIEAGQEEVNNELLDVYDEGGEEVTDGTGTDEEGYVSDEEVEGEEPTDETEKGEEDIVVIPYIDAEGVEQNWDIPVSQLPELVAKAKYGIEAEEFVRKTEEYLASETNAIKVGHAVIKDNLTKQVFLWKAQGYTDVQVAKFLNIHFTNEGENMNDAVVGQADESEVDPAMVALIEKANKPLRENLEKMQHEATVSNAINRNNEIIASTCEQLGLPKGLLPDENKLFLETFRELYPGFKNTDVITPRQFTATLKEAGIYDKYKNKPEPAKATPPPAKQAPKATVPQVKGAQAPKIAQGKPTSQPTKKTESRSKTPDAVFTRLGFH